MKTASILRYTIIFLSICAILSCSSKSTVEYPTQEGFTKHAISSHWSLQLPNGAKVEAMDSFPPNTRKLSFPGDSLFVRCYDWEEKPDQEADCSFPAREKRLNSGACDKICQGDGTMPIDYAPIVNSATQITGCRGDWVWNQQRFVIYLVNDCASGQFFQLDFSNVGTANYRLVESIIMSVEYRK